MGFFGDMFDSLLGKNDPEGKVWVNCPNCGARISLDMERCPNCGVHLDSMFQKKCPKCGTLNPLHAKKCSKCGYDFEAARIQQKMQKRVTYRCPICGYTFHTYMTRCPVCGTKFI